MRGKTFAYFASNLFRKPCTKFHQNRPSFRTYYKKKHVGLFFPDTITKKCCIRRTTSHMSSSPSIEWRVILQHGHGTCLFLTVKQHIRANSTRVYFTFTKMNFSTVYADLQLNSVDEVVQQQHYFATGTLPLYLFSTWLLGLLLHLYIKSVVLILLQQSE